MSRAARIARLAARRSLALVLALLMVSGLAFVALDDAPGSTAAFATTQGAAGSALVRYGRWLVGAVHLQLGASWYDGRPVAMHLAERLPTTLVLAGLALLLAYAVAVPLAVECAARPGGWLDRTMVAFTLALESVPSYWLGSLLMVLFAGGAYLSWFPLMGSVSDGADAFPPAVALLDRLWHLVLPVTCLSLALLATVLRVARSALGETLGQGFTRTALAKGAGRRTVVWRHGMRQAAAPLLALAAGLVAPLLGGTALVESLFGLPGVGLLAWQAAVSRDAPLLMGLLWVSALVVSAFLVAADVAQTMLDPRLGQQGESGREA